MTQRAWYLGCSSEEVGDRAVLVGDRARVTIAAMLLDNAEWLNQERGLTTVTGRYGGQQVTVAAFGMGAPIAAVVLHELASLGVRAVVRLGTTMCLSPAQMGDLVLADGALRNESTSGTYAPGGLPAVPDASLQQALAVRISDEQRRLVRGLVASYDGFYTQMFALEPHRAAAIEAERARLVRLGVVALDMETSAVLVAGRVLGVRAASLCLATVDAATQARLDREPREEAERELVAVGLDALVAVDLDSDEEFVA